jgi:raffinose/stachyose/melibiose transport system permease protein
MGSIPKCYQLVTAAAGESYWNDFFGQLIFLLGSGNETLPITIYTFSSQYSSQYHLLAAGLVLAMLPMVTAYLLLQRRIVEGFSSGIRG